MKAKIYIAVAAVIAAMLAIVIVLNNPDGNEIIWEQEQEAPADTIKMVDNVLDIYNIPTDYDRYESLVPLNMDESLIKDVSITPKGSSNSRLTIGFSQMEVNNDWRIYENMSLLKAASDY